MLKGLWLNTVTTMHEFHVTSSPWQEDVGSKINSKMEDGWEWNTYQVQTIPCNKVLAKVSTHLT